MSKQQSSLDQSSTSCKTSNLRTSSQLTPLRVDEFIKLLKEYDFKKNSVRKFSNEYSVSEKTVLKYLKQNNIDYNSRMLLIDRNRDVSGKFCLALQKSYLIRSQDEANELKSHISKIVAKNPKKRSHLKQSSKSCINKIDLNLSSNVVAQNSSGFVNPSKQQNLTYEEKVKRIQAAVKM